MYIYAIEDSDYDSHSTFSMWTDPADALWEYAEMCWTRGNGGKDSTLDLFVYVANVPYRDYAKMIPTPEVEEQGAVYKAIGFNLYNPIEYESVAE